MDIWQIEARQWGDAHYLQVACAYSWHEARETRKDIEAVLGKNWIIVVNGPGPYNWF